MRRALSFCRRMRSASVFMPRMSRIGRHGVERRAGDLAVVIHLPDQLRVAAEHAPQRVGVTAQELGRAVDDEVGAERQRVLVDGRRKGVVGDHDGADAVRRDGQPRDIHHLEGGIGRGLEVDDPAALGDGRLELVVVGRLAELDAARRRAAGSRVNSWFVPP